MDKRNFIEKLCRENEKYYSDKRGRGALNELTLTFHHSWIYLAELIQNAIDAGASRIRCGVEKNSLVFEHNGKVFSEDDVSSISQIWLSTKGAKSVGFMGIGFKAVFKRFLEVSISSGKWKFLFKTTIVKGDYDEEIQDMLGTVLPIWNPNSRSPSEGMKCRFKLKEPIKSEKPVSGDLENILGENQELLPILAIRGIKEITLGNKLFRLRLSKKNQIAVDKELIIVRAKDTSKGDVIKWCVIIQKYQPSDVAIRRFLEHRRINTSGKSEEEKIKIYADASRERTVEVFCGINTKGVPIIPDKGKLYAVLPTVESIPIGLHVQADWLLDITRGSLADKDENPWNDEISEKIPELLSEFLSWTVKQVVPKEGWQACYSALPKIYEEELKEDWLVGGEFKDALKSALKRKKVLPTFSGGSEVKFVDFNRGVLIPDSFRAFLSHELKPWILFSKSLIDTTTLGEHGEKVFITLGLLSYLTPKDLNKIWGEKIVARWSKAVGKRRRNRGLILLYAALDEFLNDSEFDDDDIQFICVPTEDPIVWRSNSNLKFLPNDWQVLVSEEVFVSAIKPFAGKDHEIVEWGLWRSITHSQYSEMLYLETKKAEEFLKKGGNRVSLEDIVSKWWESINTSPSRQKKKLIINFTCWVKQKQSTRTNLVKKVLCRSENGETKLVNKSDALVAHPYTDEYRKNFFTDLPLVVPDYLQDSMDYDEKNEWYEFFTSRIHSSQGDFKLQILADICTKQEAQKKLGYPMQDHRATYLRRRVNWEELKDILEPIEISNWEYLIVDAELPKSLVEKINRDSFTPEFARIMVEWMNESRHQLMNLKYIRLSYIPYGWGSVTKDVLKNECTWISELRDIAWVPARNSSELYKPSDVITFDDTTRPKVPVAQLPHELIDVLESCGIEFGSNIPKADVVLRLKLSGPDLALEELKELIHKAIKEGENNSKVEEELKSVLKNRKILPADASDPTKRETHEKFVLRSGGGYRSNFGGWIISVGDFDDNSIDKNILKAVHNLLPFPENTTQTQAFAYLRWVWRNQPSADSVRQHLPLAYEYLLKNEYNEVTESELQKGIESALVYAGRKNGWRPVNGETKVYLQDIDVPPTTGLLKELALATPGHLGTNWESRTKTALILGLELLSNTYEVRYRYSSGEPAPDMWQDGLAYIIELVKEYRKSPQRLSTYEDLTADNNMESGNIDESFALKRVKGLYQVVTDGEEEQRRKVMAGFENTALLVEGKPIEFSGQLSELIVHRLQLGQQVKLAARITHLLALLNEAELLDQHIRRLREDLGLETISDDMDSSEDDVESVEKDSEAVDTDTVKLREMRESDRGDEPELESPLGREGPSVLPSQKTARPVFSDFHGVSYPSSEDNGGTAQDSTSEADHSSINEVEVEGIRVTMEDEKLRLQRSEIEGEVIDKNEEYPNHPGWDLESPDPVTEDGIRRIEVKATEGRWSGPNISISTPQYEAAREHRSSYWLYIVEYATTRPKIFRIKDPYGFIKRYGFDSGWKKLAVLLDKDESESENLVDENEHGSFPGIDEFEEDNN